MALRQVFYRLTVPRNQARHFYSSTKLLRSAKDENASEDGNKQSAKPTSSSEKAEAAKSKLSDLLNSMLKEPSGGSSSATDFKLSLNLAKPKPRVKEPKKSGPKSKLDPAMLKAVDGVATGGVRSEETKGDLVAKLEAVAAETELARKGQIAANKEASKSLNSILSELKVETKRTPPREEQRVQRKMGNRETKSESLFSGQPLGIFKKESDAAAAQVSSLTVWDQLYEKELKLSVTHPPSNGFEEMILWTEQGKLWKFPISNEQGLEDEARVGFHEHVFLERHLESWCPRRGPVRHFMELVCTGLSKNPYLTVQRKKEHIEWFRRYFEAKRDILVEVNAIDSNHQFKSISSS